MSILDTLGAIIVGLMVLAAAAYGLHSLFSKSNISATQQNIVMTRMQVQQMFYGASDYSGLDNATAIKSGVVPKAFIKGDDLKNPWGGRITLSSDAANASFKISLDNIPQDACAQLAKFQPDAWLSIDINGTKMGRTSGVVDLIANCGVSNTITYEAR